MVSGGINRIDKLQTDPVQAILLYQAHDHTSARGTAPIALLLVLGTNPLTYLEEPRHIRVGKKSSVALQVPPAL
jgi:hypothetical protein